MTRLTAAQRTLPTLLICVFCANACAEETWLRWKFDPAQTLRWSFGQRIQLETPGPGGLAKSEQVLALDFDVRVEDQSDADTRISLGVSRVRARMRMEGLDFDYDSAAPQASGNGHPALHIVNASVARLLRVSCSATLDPSGLVRSMDLGPEVRALLDSGHDLRAIRILLDETGFSSLYLGGFVTFPEQPVQAGHSWKSSVVSDQGALGGIRFDHLARYAGPDTVNGMLLEKIELAPSISLDTTDGASRRAASGQIRLGRQSGTGVAYFDAGRGRMSSSEWTVTAELLFGESAQAGRLTLTSRSVFQELHVED